MRRFVVFAIIGLVLAGVGISRPTSAETLAQRLSGRILLQVESYGRIWYISPLNKQRYFLKDDPSTLVLFKDLSVAMSIDNLNLIPLVGSTETGSAALRLKFSGRIVRQSGTLTMWYVSPLNKLRYPLGDLPRAAVKKLALGISNASINTIPVAFGFGAPATPVKPVIGLLRVQKSVVTSRGTYTIDIMTLDTSVTTAKVMTDTALNSDCSNGCTTLPLKTYIDRRKATAGMHGTYFCPLEYASCVGQTGSFLYPVFNSFTGVMINGNRIKYTSQPMVAFDTMNHPFFYPEMRLFTSYNDWLADFSADSRAAGGNGALRSAISNGPAMIVAGRNVLDTGALDTKQATVKSYRGALGWKGTTLYFMVVRGATVTDSAAVMQALGLDYAINLDGGGSTAMYQNGAYVIGPGRNLPNAILLVP